MSKPPNEKASEWEELLDHWPAPQRDDSFWNANHDAIMNRIRQAGDQGGEEATDVFSTPLPRIAGEPSALLPREQESARGGGSLKDFAQRMLDETATEDGQRDSAVHLSAAVRQEAALAASTLSGTEDAAAFHVPPQPPPNVLTLPTPTASHASGDATLAIPIAAAGAVSTPPPGNNRRGGVWWWAAGAAAVAAGAALWLGPLSPTAPTTLRASAEAPAVDNAAAATPLAAPGVPSVTLAEPAVAAQERTGQDLDSLPEVAPAPVRRTTRVAAAKPAEADVAPIKVDLEETTEEAAQAEASAEAADSPPVTENGEVLIADNPKMRPAAERKSLEQQPAVGAVQSALGQVMSSARACVAGQTGPSRAQLTFGSDGKVQSVAVTGPAQGTPAEACLQTSLGRARVAPFAKPSFSVRATVRP